MSAFGLLFLTRGGCQMCQESQPVVMAEAARRDAHLEIVDVDSDQGLRAVYGDRVPVVLTASTRTVVTEGRFSRRDLRRALKRL